MNDFDPVAVQILSNDETIAAFVAELGVESDLALSPVRSTPRPPDLNFDFGTVAAVLSAVTAVVSAAKAGKQVVEFILARMRRDPAPIVVKIGQDRIEISPGADPEKTRRLLEAALHLVG